MPRCPALFIAAPSSGEGKTTVTAALARLHVREGRRARVFKCGPDFLDPQIHAFASGQPCHTLDLGMCGERDAAWRLAAAADDADLILIEGVMGLFDGQPSGADIARRFGVPVLAVINAAAMAQTFGAIAHGLATFQPGLPFSGVLANHVGSAGHGELLRESLPAGMRFYGAIPKDADAALPERHLGLLQAGEITDLGARLERIAGHLAATSTVELPPAVDFADVAPPAIPPLLAGIRIAIARDAAFGFIYPANLDCLRALGARLEFFSPVAGDELPDCDALWLPGGYPELHAANLASRRSLWQALAAHVAAGRPLLAECGGMMCLFETLRDKTGQSHPLGGLLPGEVILQNRLAALGTQVVELPEGRFSGHTFHYSKALTPLLPLAQATPLAGRPRNKAGEAVYRVSRLTASYLHFYFPSNPQGAARLFSR
ncbi:MAG TPA: cobyrinate a,c-diamide synthase [Accumulibacter sp.]|uniref:cobyrinate a,c-diamide synthase n=1 Tax=Accumulibacter sp. TaxID=2053492 RepID=UPI002878B04E|nr:cobyrinate a,c-diamide synthase [Accumulibacter sp.]MDS4077208.1 cobyrinate a,c-diamide synthase [Accumulibacter sp.]HMX23692.1 cobyrinate a,c-diamide synthase [Accumulibacter sp.]HNE14073.1 cobyrinate a,c-diamide synthase [Accumulibacter sp.]HNL15310.1 cobyrinate a,c-diamide synthase [Accumulibacter sp.]HNL98724.1 cobyrinate a,c-diamide synthase [Accumulibacter sp.]